jgi:PqqD family protein of HPr-rel-A system
MSEEPSTRFGDADVPRPIIGLHVAVIDGGVVVLDQRSGKCHVLNPTASIVWESLDGERSVREIIDALVSDFDADPAVIAESADDALRQFVEIGILEIGNGQVEPDSVGEPDEMALVAAREARRARWAGAITRGLAARDGVSVLGTFGFLDVVAEIGTEDPALARDLADLLGPLVESQRASNVSVWILDRGTPGSNRVRVYVGGRLRGSFPSAAPAVEFLLRDLNARAIVETKDMLLLHAGAVERDGHVIVIAGVSGDGKSTLTAALAASGFRYLTDELVAVEPTTGIVGPFAKPLDLDGASRDLLGIDPCPSGEQPLDLVSATRLGTISTGGRIVVLVVLDPGAADPIEMMDPVECLTALLPNVFHESFARESVFQELADLCRSTPSFRLARVTVERSVELLVEQFDRAVGPV